MKKVLIGFLVFCCFNYWKFYRIFTSQADHGRPPAPQRPDYISNVADFDHGRPPAPAYEYGDTYIDHGEHI